MEQVLASAKGIKTGSFTEEGVNLGPVINQSQLDKIMAYIESGK